MYTTKIKAHLKALKGKLLATTVLLTIVGSSFAQQKQPVKETRYEDFGNTLNLGVGLVYSNVIAGSAPIFMVNYEFNVARDFTLAPFIGIATYTSANNFEYANEHYYYRETIIPIGVKGTYYFNRLLHLNPKWDIYAAASVGYLYDNISWENGYGGSEHISDPNHLFLDLHAGAEYHISRRIGIFLDLSTGISTIGLAIHHR